MLGGTTIRAEAAMPASPPIDVRCFSGAAVLPYLEALAALRIAVFREWPYLYEGDPAYETNYLATYAHSADSLFVLAFEGAEPVGAATGVPLAAEPPGFSEPVRAQGIDPAQVFYFGESVLLPAYRGRGIGRRFFDERERFAASLGFPVTGFYAVLRDLGDPRRPAEYRPLDPFWRGRGYAPLEGAVAELEWKETWHEQASEHRMQFWVRGGADRE